MLSTLTLEKELIKNKYKLLGQIEILDEEYEELLAYARGKMKYFQVQTIAQPDLKLAIAMVQIAIRCYKEGSYWPRFAEILGCELQNRTSYLGSIFLKTLREYDLFIIKKDVHDMQMYVENIKAHAFVTDYYMEGFYDFSYAYFEKNLFRELTDDFDEDIEDLAGFMQKTLDSSKDTIYNEEPSKKAAKTYRLLKSTRELFAQCDVDTIHRVFYPVLELIDKYYYDDEVPKLPQNRFEKGFVKWCEKQELINKVNKNNVKSKKQRELNNRKPYLKVDMDKELSFLVIPQQKFRNADCIGEAHVEVSINGYIESFELDLYKSFGIFISEELRIPIPCIFDAIDIKIKSESEKTYHISKSEYRIFDDFYKSHGRFGKGHNYLLVKKGVVVKWLNEENVIDFTDDYMQWQYFSVQICDESICYIGNKPLSVVGEFSIEPVFEKTVDYFSVINKQEKEMLVVRVHPTVSFVVDKQKLNGSVLWINDCKYPVNKISAKTCYDWPEDANKMAVTVFLSSVLEEEDGLYKIILDIPGESNRLVTEYLLLKYLSYRLNKSRYIYDTEAQLQLFKGNNNIGNILNYNIREIENENSVIYDIPIDASAEEARFSLVLGDEYIIKIPLTIFSYGFSEKELLTQKSDYIWYSDLRETLYIKATNATSVRAYWGHERHNKVNGVEIKEGLYRLDISQFVRRVEKENTIKWQYINIEYEDNKPRQLSLPGILRNAIVDPYFCLDYYDGLASIDANVIGKADVFVDVVNTRTREKIVCHREIKNGVTEFPEIQPNMLYDIVPVMEETDEFGFDTKETYMKEKRNCVCISMSELSGCQFPVEFISYKGRKLHLSYEYFVVIGNQIGTGLYEGAMYGLKLSKETNEKGKYELDREGNLIKRKFGKIQINLSRFEEERIASINMYSYRDEEWMPPFYDGKGEYLVHCDSDILDSTEVEIRNRFLYLDDMKTDFKINIKRLRRFKNDAI